jgi:hypothetical protein
LPTIVSKFYTRSALVKNLIPLPSEGKIRAKFGENQISYPELKKRNNVGRRTANLTPGPSNTLSGEMLGHMKPYNDMVVLN